MPRARLVLGLAALGVALAIPAVVALPYPRDVLIRIFLFATLAQAWNILAGYCGQISLGHAIFFGTGAYTSGMFVAKNVASPWLAMVVGALIAVALSQVIGRRSSGCAVTTSPSRPSPSARSCTSWP
jgi:branched-chain amino acid transport system permease protein